MKRMLTIALALITALILMTTVLAESTATDLATPTDPAPAPAPAGPTFQNASGIWGYTRNDNGTVTLTSYQGDAAVPVVPSYVNGVRVTALGEGLFAGNTAIVSVKLPYGVKVLGDSAFEGCTGLSKFNIPSSVYTLGSKVFGDCSALAELFVPGSVQELNIDMFANCTGMTVRTFKGCAPAKYFIANPEAVPGTLILLTNNIKPAKEEEEEEEEEEVPCKHENVIYMKNIDNPGYNHLCICLDCGEDLGEEFCEIDPDTLHCIKCKAPAQAK